MDQSVAQEMRKVLTQIKTNTELQLEKIDSYCRLKESLSTPSLIEFYMNNKLGGYNSTLRDEMKVLKILIKIIER